ncbi:SPIN90/Ldb17 leucine-rich domain-containing protein [Entamoeba marina]
MQWIKAVYNDIVSTELDEGPKIEELLLQFDTSNDKLNTIYDISLIAHTNHSVFLPHIQVLLSPLKTKALDTEASHLTRLICEVLIEITTKLPTSDGFEEELIVEGIYKECDNFDEIICTRLQEITDIQTIQTLLRTMTHFHNNYPTVATFSCFMAMSPLFPVLITNLTNSYLHKEIITFLISVCSTNSELQKLLVFNGLFDSIIQAFNDAQFLKRPSQVTKYFELLHILLYNNTQNQYHFREMQHTKTLMKFLSSVTAQTVSDLQDEQLRCLLSVFDIIDIFLSPTTELEKNQKHFISINFLDIICPLTLSDIPYPPSFAPFLRAVCFYFF